MAEKIFVPIIVGTSRKGNLSSKVGEFLLEEAKSFGFESELFSPQDFLTVPKTIPPWQKEEGWSEEWKEVVEKAKGFVLVIPEYNHGYPGELKLLLDQQYENYNLKPVLICGVSGGGFGGARVVEHIKPVLIELGLVPLGIALYFWEVRSFFKDEERLNSTKEKVNSAFKELKDLILKLQG